MYRRVKARIKGYFNGIAYVTIDDEGNIDTVDDIEDINDTENCEIIEIIY